ncbi:hypothetical protein GCM10020256_21970 [Streptomyces thermocoprophilus]
MPSGRGPAGVFAAGGGVQRPVGLGPLVHHLEIAFGGGGRLLAHRQQEPDRLHGPAQREGRRQERHQRPRGQLPVGHLHRTDHERGADRDLGQGDDDRPDGGEQAGLAQFGAAQGGRQFAEGAGLAAVASEALDDADAEDALLDDGRQIADLVLGEPGGIGVPLLEDHAHHDHRDDRAEDHQAQRPVLRQHDDHADEDRHAVDQQEGQREGEEHAQQHQIGGGARQQLARRPPVVEGDRQPL